MAAFCLIQSQANKFIKGLRSGEIDPDKLSGMASAERHDYLSRFVGENNATGVNSLFESKLLLKNQQTGMINWAKKVAGLTPEVKRDLITRIGKLDTVLNPAEQERFLTDLATTKLGTDVTAEEANKVFTLSNKIKDAEVGSRAYGQAKVDLINYVNELKGLNKLSLKSVTDVAGLSKSIKASLDNSAIFRQGWKTLLTNPKTWAKNAATSFSDIARTLGGKEVLDEVKVDQFTRDNEINGNYKKMGIALGNPEEAFPTTLPEKIPLFGRLYKASETAYTGFVYRLRMDIADKYLDIARRSNVDLTPNELKSIGSMVNSLTGRGNLGKYEGSAANAFNNVFFSPRNVKAQFDTLGHVVTGAGGSNFVRKQAARNLVKITVGIAGIMAVANAVQPGSAETDPRSADFGKIKVGNTRFDITGGMSSLITLASRLATFSSKSTTTGQINLINSGKYGAQTGQDVVVDFLTNKASPITSVVLDLLKQKDRNGNTLTVGGEVSNLLTPLPITTFQDLKKDPNSANTVLAMIADGLGISTNTYGQTQKSWLQNPTKEQAAFQKKVGDTIFNQVNQEFNTQYDQWFAKTKQSSTYKNLSSQDKQAVTDAKKAALQTQLFKANGFKYKVQKQNTSTIKQKKSIINKLIK